MKVFPNHLGYMLVCIGLLFVAVYCMPRVAYPEGFENTEGYTFIMYYAPWCGHCKTAKPEFLKLGESQTIFGKVVKIRLVDPKEQPNEVMPGVKVRGYPTIHLYGPDNTLLEEYSGDRTYDGFLQFLQTKV